MNLSRHGQQWGRAVTAMALGLGLALAVARPAGAVDIQEVVSPGGIVAWLVEDHALPVIAMSYSFSGGSTQDAAGKEGTSLLVAATLNEGAGDLDSQAFAGRLQEESIDIGFDTSLDQFLGTFRTLTGRSDEAFDLLRLALNAPRFDAEPVERMRAELVGFLRSQETDPDAQADKALWAAAFPGHPYGRPVYGTAGTMAVLSADDLRDYQRRVLARDELYIAVVGDIDAATLAARLDEVFGGLPASGDLNPVPDAVAVGGVRVDIPMDLQQTVVVVAGNGIRRDNPDFMAPRIADHVFGGGGFSSRLFAELRDKRGLVYSPYSGAFQLDHAGLDVIYAATRADRAGETIAVIGEEVARYAAEGPTDAEIDAAKRYLIGNYALRFESSAGTASTLLAMQVDGLPADYINQRTALIESITPVQVREAASRLFGGGDRIVVTVGLPQ